MCGRYVQSSPLSAYVDALGVEVEPPDDEGREPTQTCNTYMDTYREPTWNLAPSLLSWAFSWHGGKPAASLFRWGLSPFWAKPGSQKPINARAESAATKPYFRKAWQESRCLVPADGWFEWRETPNGKQASYIRRADGRPSLFAALYEPGSTDKGEPTFAIVTTSADAGLCEVHDRRPVVLSPEAALRWIDPSAARLAVDQIVAEPVRALRGWPRGEQRPQ